MMAAGVANPMAQGQAMMRTEAAVINAMASGVECTCARHK
jgi:hypothetical protein